MKTLSIISYVVGSILLIVSCFTTGVAVTWILGGISILFLILGCIFQYNTTRKNESYRRKASHHFQ